MKKVRDNTRVPDVTIDACFNACCDAWRRYHEGRKPFTATPMPPPRAADPRALRVATTRSHPGPAIEKAIARLRPAEVVRAGVRAATANTG